jgi:hypothetical protein
MPDAAGKFFSRRPASCWLGYDTLDIAVGLEN